MNPAFNDILGALPSSQLVEIICINCSNSSTFFFSFSLATSEISTQSTNETRNCDRAEFFLFELQAGGGVDRLQPDTSSALSQGREKTHRVEGWRKIPDKSVFGSR